MTMLLERMLHCEVDGVNRSVTMALGPVEHDVAANAWICRCHVPVAMTQPRKAYGEDQVQAFLNGVEMCRGSIRAFCDATHELWWLERGNSGGI
jgi:hypothetical protein